jgi:beta-glucosidase
MRFLMLAILALAPCARAADNTEKKISELIGKMTLEEKLGQLQQLDGSAEGDVPQDYYALAEKGLLGSTLNVRGVKRVNELQRAAMRSRLHIPLIFGFDVIHGYRTIFPVPLGEAASFDTDNAREAASIAADEAYAAGVRWTFAPMVDIARDPRWGRIVEGSGEDTYLGSQMARARVLGFQGTDYSAPGKIAACAKHWAGYGAAEGGRDYNTTNISERNLDEYYFPPFKAAVDAGVATFMSAFNDLNGIPCTGNEWLIRGVLKSSWSFEGFVVSDYNAVKELVNHGLAADEADAARLGITAGVDMEMVSRLYNNHAPELLKKGLITEAQIDEAVRRILRVKFRAGLFENPYAEQKLEDSEILTSEHTMAAKFAAEKSFVLLKNDGGTLPVRDGVKHILLAGALADDQEAVTGSWNGDVRTRDSITIRKGLGEAAKDAGAELTYVRGAGPAASDTDNITEAVEAARNSDMVIAVVGEQQTMSGEASSRADISLPGRQLELVKALVSTGKPVAVLLMTGRPVIINWLAEHAPAVMEIWYPGTMAGRAVADVVFGKVSPGGKLPVTWPLSEGQIPLYYNHKNTGRPFEADNKYTSKYLDITNAPQYPFGYGLSYSTFTISDMKLSADRISKKGNLTVTVNVRNTGDVKADEVAQLYIHKHSGSVTRPVRELKGFKRVTLDPGEMQTVQFTLGPNELGFYGKDLKFAVEPGDFDVWVGTSSEGGNESSFTVLP